MDASEPIVRPDFQAFLHLHWRKGKLEKNTGILPVNTITQTEFCEILKADSRFQSHKAYKNMPIPGKVFC